MAGMLVPGSAGLVGSRVSGWVMRGWVAVAAACGCVGGRARLGGVTILRGLRKRGVSVCGVGWRVGAACLRVPGVAVAGGVVAGGCSCAGVVCHLRVWVRAVRAPRECIILNVVGLGKLGVGGGERMI